MIPWASVLPLLVFIAGATALAGVLLLLAKAVHRGRPNPVKQMPYESGVDPFHDTRRPFDVRFYLVAVAFLVFDVEVLFLYPWAVAAGGLTTRSAEMQPRQFVAEGAVAPMAAASSAGADSVEYNNGGAPLDGAVEAGWVGSRHLVFGGVGVFFALLVLGLAYDWRKGVFRWR